MEDILTHEARMVVSIVLCGSKVAQDFLHLPKYSNGATYLLFRFLDPSRPA